MGNCYRWIQFGTYADHAAMNIKTMNTSDQNSSHKPDDSSGPWHSLDLVFDGAADMIEVCGSGFVITYKWDDEKQECVETGIRYYDYDKMQG